MKKKILYVITKSVWGGAQRYVYDLATSLPKDRFEAVILTGEDGPLIEKLEQQQVRVIRFPGITKNINIFQELKSLFYLGKIFVHEKPDVIHLNSSKFGGLGAVAAFVYKITSNQLPVTIFTAHGWPFNENRNFLIRCLIYFFSWLTAIFSNHTINLTRHDYKQSLNFPLIPKNKFILIPNGIADETFFMMAAEAKKFLAEKTGLDLHQSPFLIGTIAELTKNKGLLYLIDAISQVNFKVQSLKFKVVVVGEGEERPKLEYQIKSFGLEKTVFLAGFIPEAAKYLQGFDAFVLPSIKEGLPYALMEAMAAGLPIIASRVGGIPDLVENGKSGILVNAKDSAALAQKIEKLMQNQETRITLGKEAKARVETSFRFRDMLERTLKIYDDRRE